MTTTQEIQNEINQTKRQLIGKAQILEQKLEERVEKITSWKQWVQAYPMTCVVISAIVGFLIVQPQSKSKSTQSETTSSKKGSWLLRAISRYATGVVTAGAMRLAISVANKHKGEVTSSTVSNAA